MRKSMVHIQVLRPDNSAGLSRDGEIVNNLLLKNGYKTTLTNSHADVLEFNNRKFDINLFLEVVHGKYLRQARVNVIIPNPEWFPKRWLSYRRRFHKVLCKTRHALNIFNSNGFTTEFIGFTSDNRYDGTSFEDKKKVFLHAPGRSQLKSTDQVIKAWENNPDFPTLYLVTSYGNLSERVLEIDNIDYTYGYVKENSFIELQNKVMFHVMPSRSEGFGHSIVEPMSTGAILITTDGVPMNELVSGFAYLCDAKKVGDFNLGPLYTVPPESIAEQVRAVLSASDDELKERSRKARLTFAENHKRFEKLFVESIRSIPL